jgi:hypothetical protein
MKASEMCNILREQREMSKVLRRRERSSLSSRSPVVSVQPARVYSQDVQHALLCPFSLPGERSAPSSHFPRSSKLRPPSQSALPARASAPVQRLHLTPSNTKQPVLAILGLGFGQLVLDDVKVSLEHPPSSLCFLLSIRATLTHLYSTAHSPLPIPTVNMSSSTSSNPPLRVAIVGGGIAGLCTALALAKKIEEGANIKLDVVRFHFSLLALSSVLPVANLFFPLSIVRTSSCFR